MRSDMRCKTCSDIGVGIYCSRGATVCVEEKAPHSKLWEYEL